MLQTTFTRNCTKSNFMRFVFLVMILTFSNATLSQITTGSSEERLKKLNAQINALRAKRDFLKSDPVQDSIAKSVGWYSSTHSSLGELISEKTEIIKSTTGKTWISLEEMQEMYPEKLQVILSSSDYIIEEE